MKTQSIRQVFKVTEWKDGCVFRTESIGFAWITVDKRAPDSLQYVALSTSLSKKLEYNTLRSVADDAPDFVEVKF